MSGNGRKIRIDDALAQGARELAEVSESARLDAELLLARALDLPRAYLAAHPEDLLDEAAAERYFATIARRREGWPLAYITGEKEFWSLPLTVSPAVLIPRPETELLVELALRLLPRREPCAVLDLGTGSGAIALAIARERPLSTVTATDVSEDALAVARQNARRHDLPNVEFLLGDWIEPVQGRRFDLVVSNPPYVREDDPALAALRFEPRVALTPGEDALSAVRVLARDARALLDEGGPLVLEHGSDQARDVAEILAYHGWTGIETHNDLTGRPRATLARRGAPAG